MDGKRLQWLYIATLSLLAVHEIDSAYWSEWDLFGIPGGIQLFLVLNLLLLVPLLYGLARVVRSPRAGAPFGMALSCAGLIAFGLHSWFLARGSPEFRLPVSLAILGTALVASLALGWASLRALRGPES